MFVSSSLCIDKLKLPAQVEPTERQDMTFWKKCGLEILASVQVPYLGYHTAKMSDLYLLIKPYIFVFIYIYLY